MGVVSISQKLSQGKYERSVFGIGPEIQYYFDLQKEEDKFKGKSCISILIILGFVI
jgi:hypothetical protein